MLIDRLVSLDTRGDVWDGGFMAELTPTYSREDARDAILEGGLAVFAEAGFHGATMRDIARSAGVSQGLLHHHFGNKNGLWDKVGERITADFMAYMTEAVSPDLSPEDGIRAMLRALLAYWQEHPLAFRFNHWRQLDGPRGERAARSRHIAQPPVALFQKAQEAGFIRKDMPPGLALIVTGSIIQFWLHSRLEIRDALAVTGDEGLGDEAFLDHVVSLVRAVP
jgi:TetR/AcrR family transcriptional regulator